MIEELKEQGIIFDKGLSSVEISTIEKKYDLIFPSEMKSLYRKALLISRGFYNWRDFSERNTQLIKQVLNRPTDSLLNNTSEIDWSESWGSEPANQMEREEVLREKIQSAPKLIPIYSHRYITSFQDRENPVFSIVGSDIIYYGENLISYLEIEFGCKSRSDMDITKIEPVSFWSDLL
ncbi:MAG: hypothetical protein LBV19_02055 [Streptococcaceae bacterium]|nr:hypothetical protein [Streptococcaceae bacterium]